MCIAGAFIKILKSKKVRSNDLPKISESTEMISSATQRERNSKRIPLYYPADKPLILQYVNFQHPCVMLQSFVSQTDMKILLKILN